MNKECIKKIDPEPKNPLKKISEKEIKINPKLIKPLMKELDSVKEENRLKHLRNIGAEIEIVIEETRELAKSKNIDFKTALDERVPTKKRSSPLQK